MKLESRPESEYKADFEVRQAKIKQLQDAGKGDWKSLVSCHLGEKWTVTNIDRRLGGECGSVTATLTEGDATLGVTVKSFSNNSGLALTGSWNRGDYNVHQGITKDFETGKIEEYMSLIDPRVKPEPIYVLQPMI
jgi:hypothetical protein